MSADEEPLTYEIEIPGTADGGGERIPDLSPREARDRWLDRLRAQQSDSTVSAYHYRTQQFVEFCEVGGIDSISEVTGWDVDTFETKRRGEGLRPSSLNNEIDTLRELLKYCARIGLVDEELPEKVQAPPVPKEDNVSETKLPTERAKTLLDYYETTPEARHSRAHAVLATAWYVPARMGAFRGLDLENYHPEEQYFEFLHRPDEGTPLKNGYDGERIVGLPEELCEILDGYIETDRYDNYDDYGRRPLFASQRGRPSTSGFRGWMYLATVPCLHSPCPHGNDPETCDFLTYTEASKCPSSVSPHPVRRGSITWHRNRGWPLDELAERANTSVRVLKKHYDQPDRFEEMQKRRSQFLDHLGFEAEEEGQE